MAYVTSNPIRIITEFLKDCLTVGGFLACSVGVTVDGWHQMFWKLQVETHSVCEGCVTLCIYSCLFMLTGFGSTRRLHGAVPFD